jgi:hypothetical protein
MLGLNVSFLGILLNTFRQENTMSNLEEIYDTLKDLKYCEDQADFSVRWLGRSEGYYAYLKSSGAPPCLVSLSMLVALIFSIIPTVDESARYVERRRLRAAWVSAGVMLEGERDIAFARKQASKPDKDLPPFDWKPFA